MLTPVQDARLLVEAYPAAPDPVQLSALIAHELKDPSADYSLAGVPAPELAGLLPAGLSALSALPYVVPGPREPSHMLTYCRLEHQVAKGPAILIMLLARSGMLMPIKLSRLLHGFYLNCLVQHVTVLICPSFPLKKHNCRCQCHCGGQAVRHASGQYRHNRLFLETRHETTSFLLRCCNHAELLRVHLHIDLQIASQASPYPGVEYSSEENACSIKKTPVCVSLLRNEGTA